MNVATRGPFVKTVGLDGPRINLLIARIFHLRLSKPHAGAPTVFVDERDARRFQRFSKCSLIRRSNRNIAVHNFDPANSSNADP
jgi:hypothetical protein